MPTDVFAVTSFALIAIFTPGPNNISCAAMGALHGYRRTFRYMLGITGGFLLVMFACALVSASLLSLVPGLEAVLRYVGAVYIVYLAFKILKASYTYDAENSLPLAFTDGFLLQWLNPKGIVFGLTLFSTFLASAVSAPFTLVVAVLLLTLAAFCAISLWALFGTFIKRYLRAPRARLALNVCLSLFLVYTALDLAAIL